MQVGAIRLGLTMALLGASGLHASPAVAAPDLARPIAASAPHDPAGRPSSPASGWGPNPLLAGVLTGFLGAYPFGVLPGYAYAGDLDRGWQVVGWQGKAALVGGGVGLALAPVMIWGRSSSPLDPHGGASAMLWLPVAPVVGALVAHTCVGWWAGWDAFGVAARWPSLRPEGASFSAPAAAP